jgi:hypothetical protein
MSDYNPYRAFILNLKAEEVLKGSVYTDDLVKLSPGAIHVKMLPEEVHIHDEHRGQVQSGYMAIMVMRSKETEENLHFTCGYLVEPATTGLHELHLLSQHVVEKFGCMAWEPGYTEQTTHVLHLVSNELGDAMGNLGILEGSALLRDSQELRSANNKPKAVGGLPLDYEINLN